MTLVYMCQHTTTRWCSRKKKSTLWAEIMRTAAHVINKIPQQRLGFISPFEIQWDMKPTVSYFRVFGCVCYVFVSDNLGSKFDKKAISVYLLDLTIKEKGGSVVIQQVDNTVHQEM